MKRTRGLEREILRGAQLLESAEVARVFCHRDADGICGAAIISSVLSSRGLDAVVSSHLPGDLSGITPSPGLNVMVDIGSGQLGDLGEFEGADTLVLDHHPPEGDSLDGMVQVNPHQFGIDGSTEISGSGVAYLLSKAVVNDPQLAKVGVIGAIADRQDLLGELMGLNREILADAIEADLVEEVKDVLLYGRESRPLHISLMSFQDPPIPGVSGSESGAMQLLSELGIPLRNGRKLRTLGELNRDERRELASELVVRCIAKTSPEVAGHVPRLIIGSVYRMTGEISPLQYASEFATVVNSAARMGFTEEGVGMLLGDRGDQYRKVISGLGEYRRMVSREIRKISGREILLGREGYLQYFESETTPRTIIGPVTGLILGGGLADPYKPLVGMVKGHVTKASSRCSKILVLEGLDLSSAASQAARRVGGEGGGHRGAAGAFFPSGREKEFVQHFEEGLVAQVRSSESRSAP
jgi:RecJ-like exonuclease